MKAAVIQLPYSTNYADSEIVCRFCAFNINAYLLRATVTFGENSHVGGAGMIVSPKGEILANLKGSE